MRAGRIASFLAAMTMAAGAWVIAAPAASATNDYTLCLQGAKHAGLHKAERTAACEQAEAGNVDDCAAMIAKEAKPPVKGDVDKAKQICGRPAEPPPD